ILLPRCPGQTYGSDECTSAILTGAGRFDCSHCRCSDGGCKNFMWSGLNAIMLFNLFIWIADHPQRADQSAVIRINLRRSKKRKRPSDGSNVGAGEELGGIGAL